MIEKTNLLGSIPVVLMLADIRPSSIEHGAVLTRRPCVTAMPRFRKLVKLDIVTDKFSCTVMLDSEFRMPGYLE